MPRGGTPRGETFDQEAARYLRRQHDDSSPGSMRRNAERREEKKNAISRGKAALPLDDTSPHETPRHDATRVPTPGHHTAPLHGLHVMGTGGVALSVGMMLVVLEANVRYQV